MRRYIIRDRKSYSLWNLVLSVVLFLMDSGLKWIPRLIKFITPGMTEYIIANEDRLLAGELAFLKESAWAELEIILWGKGKRKGRYANLEAPYMDKKLKKEARKKFYDWLAYTDALAECNFPMSAKISGSLDKAKTRAHLLTAADLYAEAARRIMMDLLRSDSSSSGSDYFKKWNDCFEGWKEAERFIKKEIFCLEKVCNQRIPSPLDQHYRELAVLLKIGERDLPALNNVRLSLAYLSLLGLRQLVAGKRGVHTIPRSPSKEVWDRLREYFNDLLRRWREEYGEEWLGETPPEVEKVLKWRLRYFDASLYTQDSRYRSIIQEIRDNIEQWPEDWRKKEYWVLGHALLIEAKVDELDGELLKNSNLETITAFRSTEHCSLLTLDEVLRTDNIQESSDDSTSIDAAFDEAAQCAIPPKVPTPPKLTGENLQGKATTPLSMSRPPNCFTRAALVAAGLLFVFFPIALLFNVTRAGGMVQAPDFRIGGRHLCETVNSISPGREEEPSVWIATQGGGVHVKAGGHDHHWNRISEADSGLLSNDVLRVDVGSDQIAFLCAGDGRRRGLCLSTFPDYGPGAWPGFGLDDWWTFLGFSSFPGVHDDVVTCIEMPEGCPVLLLGTRGYGLGRYKVDERRWLDAKVLNEDEGFLPEGHRVIHDMAIFEDGDRWIAWLGTDNGLAGGPVGYAASSFRDQGDLQIRPRDWRITTGQHLIDRKILQVEVRRRESGLIVDYRTASRGLGSVQVPDKGETTVLVSNSFIPGLAGDRLLKGAYDAKDPRIWLLDRVQDSNGPNGGKVGERISLYRERTHEWKTVKREDWLATGTALDLVADVDQQGQALVGTRSGLLVVRDGKEPHLESRNLGPEGFEVSKVVAAPEGCGIVAFGKNSDNSDDNQVSSLVHLPRDCAAADCREVEDRWLPLIGPKRFTAIQLGDFNTIESSSRDSSLYFGTKKRGVGFINTESREVYALESEESASRSIHQNEVLDLCLVPEEEEELGQRDSRLYRATGDHLLDVLDNPRGERGDRRGWRSVFNHTFGGCNLKSLLSAQVCKQMLFLGAAGSLTCYDINSHTWKDLPELEGFLSYWVSEGELWAHAGEKGDCLYVLTGGGYTLDSLALATWCNIFQGVKSFDAADDGMFVVGQDNSLKSFQGGMIKNILAPEPLPEGDDEPTVAAVDGTKIYLAPVHDVIGRYDLARHSWGSINLPFVDCTPNDLRLNDLGLWLVDHNKSLYLNPKNINGSDLAGWEGKSRAVQVKDAFFGKEEVLVLREDGHVLRITGDQTYEVVGAPFAADELDKSNLAALVFDEDLIVSTGCHMGRYHLPTHSWTSISPTGNNRITMICTTERYLYVLDEATNLLRLERGREQKWQNINVPAAFENRFPACIAVEGNSTSIGSVFAMKNCLGVIIEGLGVFQIYDNGAEEFEWIQACSRGPGPEAEIYCAAEIGSDLYLGTEAQGLWGYLPCEMAGGGLSPSVWSKLPLGDENEAAKVEQIMTLPDDRQRMVVQTSESLVYLERTVNGDWKRAGSVGHCPLSAALSKNGVFWTEAESSGATALKQARNQTQIHSLIGDACPDRGGFTKSVAVDPVTHHLYRTDDKGSLSRYEWDSHRWRKEEIETQRGNIESIFACGGRLWAWCPADSILYTRAGDNWIAFQPQGPDNLPVPLTQVVWNKQGMLLRGSSEELFVFEPARGTGAQCILPASARQCRVGWDHVRAIGEISPCLFLGSDCSGIDVYNRVFHTWTHVGEGSIGNFRSWGDGDFLYALSDPEGELQHVSLDRNQNPHVAKVHFTESERVKSLISTDTRGFAFTEKRNLYELKGETQLDTALIRPEDLNSSQLPTIHAAAEWQGHLFLSYKCSDDGYVAYYDPGRMTWGSFAVSEGTVCRFRKIDPTGGSVRLYGEVFIPRLSRGEPMKGLIEIDRAARGFTYRFIARDLYDLADNGNIVWAVGKDRRILRLFSFNQAQPFWRANSDIDEAATDIQTYFAFGNEFISLLKDRTLWHYSLDRLEWIPKEPERKFSSLVAINGNPCAIERKTGRFFQYRKGPTGRYWTPVANPDHGGEAADLDIDRPPEKANDQWNLQWNVDAELKISWRTRGGKRDHRVCFEDRRLGFNSFERIEYSADGTLWCECLARQGDEPVYRKFRIQGGDIVAELNSGSARFQIPPKLARQSLEERSPLNLDSKSFKLEVVEKSSLASGWKGFDCSQQSDVDFILYLRFQGGNQDLVPVKLVMNNDRGLWSLDIDTWFDVAVDAGFLHASTRAGLLTTRLPVHPGLDIGRIALFPFNEKEDVDRFAALNGGLYARCSATKGEYFSFDTANRSWHREQNRVVAQETFAIEESRLKFNRFLENWKVTRTDGGAFRFNVKTWDAGFVPVSLQDGGFGFDKTPGLQMTSLHAISLYTPDGKTTYSLEDGAWILKNLENSYAATMHYPARAVVDPDDGTLVLLADAPNLTAAQTFSDEGWREMDEAEVKRLIERLRSTLTRGMGWRWNSNDTVEVTLTPFEDAQPLYGRFDSQSGQFSFDTIRDIACHGGDLWLVTDAGIMIWRDKGFTGVQLNRDSPFGHPVDAEFIQDTNGRWYLDVNRIGEAASSRLFEFDGRWTLPRDSGSAITEAKHAMSWKIYGRTWRVQTDDATPKVGANKSRRILRVAESGGDLFTPLHILEDCIWDFEHVNAMSGPSDTPVIGSHAGLVTRVRAEDGPFQILRYTPTQSAVVRMEREDRNIHVAFENRNESLFSAASLTPAGKPALAFAEIDKTLFENERWRWLRRPGKRIEIAIRPHPNCGFRPAGLFDTKSPFRFDFDRVHDLGKLEDGCMLATHHGFILRRPPDEGGFTLCAGLPELDRKTCGQSEVFSLYREKEDEIFVKDSHDDLYKLKGGWITCDRQEARDVLELKGLQVARNATWNVEKVKWGISGLRFWLSVNESKDQPVTFKANRGGFLFDLSNDILKLPSSAASQRGIQRVAVATEDGLFIYDLNGRILSIDSDSTKDKRSVIAHELIRTSQGALARVGYQYFIWCDEAWQKMPGNQAKELIKAARTNVHHDRNGWTIERDLEQEDGYRAFQLKWKEEPVSFLDDDGEKARFAHDQVCSVEMYGNDLWLATCGGVLQMEIDPASCSLHAAPGQHLWVTPFISGAEEGGRLRWEPFSLREIASQQGAALLCRAVVEGLEKRFFLDPKETVWSTVQDLNPAPLVEDEGLWNWTLEERGKVKIALAPEVFSMPSRDSEVPLFRNGTLGFWDLTPAETTELPPSAPMVFDEGWFIATSDGILHLSRDGKDILRVYGRDTRGNNLLYMSHLLKDSSTGILYAYSNADHKRKYRFSPQNDGQWHAEEYAPDLRRRPSPVDCAWLTMLFDVEQGRMKLRLRSTATDESRPEQIPALLEEGRFRFDKVEHFAWHEGFYWLITPLGIGRLDGSDGNLFLFRDAFIDSAGSLDELRTLYADSERLYVLTGEDNKAWYLARRDRWSETRDAAALNKRYSTITQNDLFTCSQNFDEELVFTINEKLGEFPEFHLGTTAPPLIKDGVFGFDDLRDVKMQGNREIVLATRLGIWHHLLADRENAHMPQHAAYYARAIGSDGDVSGDDSRRAGSPGGRRISMINLNVFSRDPEAPDELRVYSDESRQGFMLGDGGWVLTSKGIAKTRERRFEGNDGETWHLLLDDEGLQVQRQQNEDLLAAKFWWNEAAALEEHGAVINLADAFSTRTSIWLPLEKGLLWIRKAEFN